MVAIWRRVSSVALPMCGNNTVRGAARRRGWSRLVEIDIEPRPTQPARFEGLRERFLAD